ncbi:hypothetical protein [Bacillus sp. FJAT-42376]|uniref:hypothetical protein n=1 Tax=Bacillus sp. FJAT-42376 TaxID=2014076 RepID=UPI000F50B10D|nr:hypothetical protein [Bacillus sp. FJAT-42376]
MPENEEIVFCPYKNGFARYSFKEHCFFCGFFNSGLQGGTCDKGAFKDIKKRGARDDHFPNFCQGGISVQQIQKMFPDPVKFSWHSYSLLQMHIVKECEL